MVSDRDKKALVIGISIVMILTIAGILLLLIERNLFEPATSFELVVFLMAATALLLAIIQGIAIERQIRVIRHGSSRITEAVHALERLAKEEIDLERVIKKDVELDEILIDFLRHHGVKAEQKALDDLRKKLKV